jgi:DNA-directed RNA polymerase subunit RPC12/RpoP
MIQSSEIRRITLNEFITLVSQTGTERLKIEKEDSMGEARRRFINGRGSGSQSLSMKEMVPGQQVQVGPEVMRHAVQKKCSKCGGEFFIAAIRVSTISALVSPVGQELTVQLPVLVCMDCKKPLRLDQQPADKSGEPAENPSRSMETTPESDVSGAV